VSKYYVITWRPRSERVFFFRGDNRYALYLPYIGDDYISPAWVYSKEHARLFEAYPVFDSKTISKKLDVDRLRVHEYKGVVLSTHTIRSLKRPQRY